MATPSTGALPPQRDPPPIPDHELLKCIGRGGYGEVWLARNVLGTWRAIKIVYRSSFDHDRPYEREFEGIRKFEPISRSHESQVDILHVGRNDAAGFFYYVMELADDASSASSIQNPGSYIPKTLKHVLHDQGRLPLDQCLRIGLALITALDHLHRHGLVHRDVKPSNIIFVEGIPKLADIGLIASADASMSFVGTVGYVPPEGPGTPEADLYSLGKVLYEMSSGRGREHFPQLPEDWENFLDQTGLLELNAIVLKACEADPKRRYQSAPELHAELALLQSGKSVQRLRKFEGQLARARTAAMVAAGLLVILIAAYLGSRNQAARADRLAKAEAEQRQKAEQEAQRAKAAEQDAEQKLWRSYLAEAQARRWSGRVGRRINALDALKNAATIRPSLELRNEAIACLALSDLIVFKEWDGLPHGSEFGAFDAGYERYARGETNGAISVRRVEDDKELVRFPAFGPPWSGMSFSPDGKLLMQFGGLTPDRHGLRLWNVNESRTVLDFTNEVPNTATFSQDSLLLAISTFTRPAFPLRIHDTGSGKLVKSLELQTRPWGLDFHPIQTNLLATSDDGPVVRVWDWTSGAVVQTFEHRGGVKSICWHPEGNWLATACSDYGVHLWDFATGKEIAVLKGHAAAVVHVGCNRDGSLLVSRGWDGSLRLWDTAARRELLMRQVPGGLVYGFGSTDDRIGYVGAPGRIGILQVVSPAAYRVLRPREADDVRTGTCAFSRDGRMLASSYEEHIRFWDTATGREIASWSGNYRDAVFHPDGERLFTRTRSGLQEWQGHFSAVQNSITFQPMRLFTIKPGRMVLNLDGTLLGGAVQGLFELLDLPTGKLRNRIKLSSDGAAALSPDGKLVAHWPRGGPGHIEVIDLASTQTVARLPTRNGPWATFSPNGRWLAGGDNTEFTLWDRETWKLLYTVPRQFTDYWCKLTFSTDSSILAVAHSRDVVKLLAAGTGRELATLEAPEPQDIEWITFSSDGTRLAVAGAHGPIHLWDLAVLRQQLAGMKLDWELSPYPPAPSHTNEGPLRVTILSSGPKQEAVDRQ